MKKTILASLIPVILVLGIGGNVANVANAQPVSIAEPPAVPASAPSVPYTSGGVGSDERDRLEAAKSQFNLRLMFAISAGNYLSGVRVRIQDNSGVTLLDVPSNGPWFYARLPPGNYTLSII